MHAPHPSRSPHSRRAVHRSASPLPPPCPPASREDLLASMLPVYKDLLAAEIKMLICAPPRRSACTPATPWPCTGGALPLTLALPLQRALRFRGRGRDCSRDWHQTLAPLPGPPRRQGLAPLALDHPAGALAHAHEPPPPSHPLCLGGQAGQALHCAGAPRTLSWHFCLRCQCRWAGGRWTTRASRLPRCAGRATWCPTPSPSAPSTSSPSGCTSSRCKAGVACRPPRPVESAPVSLRSAGLPLGPTVLSGQCKQS